ncbi:MAG: hypothetical protein ACYC4L_03680 [Chloroflexota bacterium]
MNEASAAELRSLEERLADLREERRLTLGQTGIHVDAWTVKRLHDDFESEEARLLGQIAALRQQLEQRQ